MRKTKIDFVTLHFPILHIDTTYQKQLDKVIEEYNEFRKEIFSNAEPDRALHELQDVVQAYITLMHVRTKPTALDDQEADENVIRFFEQVNLEHRKKIERYKIDRGWN